MEKLEEMQWSVVGQEDASETEGKGLQNMGNNERTRSTTRSSKWDDDAEMDVRSDKGGSDPKWTH